jgi:hypothetical protein
MGGLGIAYAILAGFPSQIQLDMAREGPYRQRVTTSFKTIQINASEVVASCAVMTPQCSDSANRLDLSVRVLWIELTKTPPPPCLTLIDRQLRHDTEIYDAAAYTILAESSSNASVLEAVWAIANTEADVERTLDIHPRCGLARLSPFYKT